MPSGRWHRGHPNPPPSQEYDPDADPEAGPSSHPLPQVSNLERPRECINRFPTPAFSLLCTMMDRLRTEEASKRRNTLERFFELWRIKVGNDLYPLIRLLLPDVSREFVHGRGVLMIRETGRDRYIISKKQCWRNATLKF